MTIRSEIESKLADFASTQNIPVAYENIDFERPTDGPYLEVFLLGKASKLRNVAAEGKRVTGMFQVNCYAAVVDGMGDL